ncbi:MAG: protein-disulfide reductase DsbD N-terminal domain-containing protein [Burkholderiaceae bacterium]
MRKNHLLLCLAVGIASFGAQQYGFAQQSSAPGLQNRLSSLFSNTKEDELVEPDLAFRLKVAFKGPTTLVADLIPAKGYYLYKDRIKFAIRNSDSVLIKSVRLPPGKVTNDPTFGRTETYDSPIQAELILERTPKAKNFTLVASYQGCHKKTGVCYPPIDKALNLSLP